VYSTSGKQQGSTVNQDTPILALDDGDQLDDKRHTTGGKKK